MEKLLILLGSVLKKSGLVGLLLLIQTTITGLLVVVLYKFYPLLYQMSVQLTQITDQLQMFTGRVGK
jgi:hypothetical protein